MFISLPCLLQHVTRALTQNDSWNSLFCNMSPHLKMPTTMTGPALLGYADLPMIGERAAQRLQDLLTSKTHQIAAATP